MRSTVGILALPWLAALVAGDVNTVPPALRGKPVSVGNQLTADRGMTDSSKIVSTVSTVQQKGGASDSTPPNNPVPNTSVTVIDGSITKKTVQNLVHSTAWSNGKRSTGVRSSYTQVFSGTANKDAAVEGTAYLTYTLVPNNTYNTDACLDYCDRTVGCAFVNLYYEFNNHLLDHVFEEKSNLKCVAYGDIHTANEKTNWGGQQSEPAPAPLTYIQQSSGFAITSLASPETPDGYDLVFGPTDGANNAPGYMGFAFLDRYDVAACAQLCNTRSPDPVGGACLYFNIWRALVKDVPTTYTCAMYYFPTGQSTAVNYGQGDLKVTFSRGYRRESYVVDGGFEGYNGCIEFCYTDSYWNWVGTSPVNGTLDATIFHYPEYAHFGQGVGLLGSALNYDRFSGTLSPRHSLYTVPGHQYQIAFFHSSSFSGPDYEAKAFVDIMWNAKVVATIRPGYEGWTFYSFIVTAVGNDALAFHGGAAPAWSFIDDVFLFKV
ncbi:hypothetical protein M378DRAFT_357033 [Amanita muscaria Koide BX008]|uniref:Fruit-body specific protein a n=1 Tax=Amanita muscaria (strain Koide BX008) TaxID=946122 RepID=A0A0C2S591_AMAMK|nr:hypothetical protein M378DRAFT_357033 [Amanita muscaria Koide BX008]